VGFWDREDALEYVDKLDRVTRLLWQYEDRLVDLKCWAAQDARDNKTSEKSIRRIGEVEQKVKDLANEKKDLEDLMFPKR
jgi:hypothetical protein